MGSESSETQDEFDNIQDILANRPDLVGTVPIWRPKPDVPPGDPKKPIRPALSLSTPKNTILSLILPVLFVLHSEFKFVLCLLAFSHVPVRGRQLSKQKNLHKGIVLVKKFILLSFPLNARKLDIF